MNVTDLQDLHSTGLQLQTLFLIKIKCIGKLTRFWSPLAGCSAWCHESRQSSDPRWRSSFQNGSIFNVHIYKCIEPLKFHYNFLHERTSLPHFFLLKTQTSCIGWCKACNNFHSISNAISAFVTQGACVCTVRRHSTPTRVNDLYLVLYLLHMQLRGVLKVERPDTGQPMCGAGEAESSANTN